MDPQINNTQRNKLFRYIMLLVFVVLAFLLFFLYQTRKTTDEQKNFISITPPAGETFDISPVVQTPVSQKMGSFSFKSASEFNSGDLDKALDLDIIANSDQKSIVGYDVVIKFEEGAVEIASAKSLLPDFDVFPVKKSDHYIITGTKKLEANDPTIFDNAPILRLTVVPKKTGLLKLTVVETIGLEKSQMVNEESKILTPQVGEITLEIK